MFYNRSEILNKMVTYEGFDEYWERYKMALSWRETEVIQLVATGMTGVEIADELFISLNIVESHKRNIIKKMNARNIADAVVKAIRCGILD